MKLFDKSGKIAQAAIWAISAALFAASLPVIWLYGLFGRQTEGVFGSASVCIMIVYACQYPQYLKRTWLYGYVVLLAALYLLAALLLPRELPKNAPTSAFLWPWVLLTIAVDFLVLRLFVKFFED